MTGSRSFLATTTDKVGKLEPEATPRRGSHTLKTTRLAILEGMSQLSGLGN